MTTAEKLKRTEAELEEARTQAEDAKDELEGTEEELKEARIEVAELERELKRGIQIDVRTVAGGFEATWCNPQPPYRATGDTQASAIGNLFLQASKDHTSGVDVRLAPARVPKPEAVA